MFTSSNKWMKPQICTNIRIDSNTPNHNPVNSYFQNKIVQKNKKNYCLTHLKLAAAVISAIEAWRTKKMGLQKHSTAVKQVAEEKETFFPPWRTPPLNSFMLEDKLARVSHCHNDDGWEMRMKTIGSIKVIKARFSSRSG